MGGKKKDLQIRCLVVKPVWEADALKILGATSSNHGQKAERLTAKRLGGLARKGSGAIEGYKGDIEFYEFLLENKSTLKASFSVKLEWLNKISREARAQGKTPGLSIQFVDTQGRPVRHGRWVLIPEDEFREAFE